MTRPISSENALRGALNALALRQRTIANNIANVDTPGFKSSDVRFEEVLATAIRQDGGGPSLEFVRTQPGHLSTGGRQAGGTIQGEVVTRSNTTMRTDGNNVDIDEQMLHLSETAISYNALARLASMRLSLMRSVISEGRR